jgi:hypothetical protein
MKRLNREFPISIKIEEEIINRTIGDVEAVLEDFIENEKPLTLEGRFSEAAVFGVLCRGTGFRGCNAYSGYCLPGKGMAMSGYPETPDCS